MSPLIPLLEAFLFEKAISSTMLVSNKSKAGMAMFGVAAVCVLGALILTIIGVYQFLNVHYAPDVAALAAAGLVFLIAAIFGIVGATMLHKKQSRLKSMQQDITDTAMNWFEDLADELHLPEAVRRHPKTTLLVSSVVGYMIAKKLI